MSNRLSKYNLKDTCYIVYGNTDEDSLEKTEALIEEWKLKISKDPILTSINKRRVRDAV
jgi:cAMP phosphodiesterase